jgi:hypothetical protein
MMALLVPMTDILAVSHTAPLYTHFLYTVGHDGYMHYVINAWSLLVMHNLFRWYRVLAAYLFAILLSFIALPSQPMVGASVFTCFFFGFTAPWLWRKERVLLIMTAGLMLLTCVLPGFAGIPHVSAFAFGVFFAFSEYYIIRIRHYLRQ